MFTFDKDEKLTGAIVNIPCPSQNMEMEYERKELIRTYVKFLDTLPVTERRVFLCRYWYVDSIEAIAEKLNLNSYSVIYDSPITDFTIFAKERAEPLLNKGIKICYIQVYNDPVTTFKNMLHRGFAVRF
mgnify:CR=1 FL=1